MSNDLFELKNLFLLGNYQAAINAGNSIPKDKLNANDQIEKNCYIFRSYIAQGNYKLVLQEIKDSSPPALQGVRLLASYLNSKDNAELVLTTLKQWIADGALNNNPTLQIMCASILYLEENYEEALRSVYQSSSVEA